MKKKKQKLQMALFNEKKISTSQNEQTSAIVLTKRRQKTAIKSFFMITQLMTRYSLTLLMEVAFNLTVKQRMK
jgi:hypothetical protein